MDDAIAERMKNQLVGRELCGWNIEEYIDHGKSAIVFLARSGAQEAALKIFDSELVKEFGREVQLARIEREKSLIGKEHPHLIRILDGGAGMLDDEEHMYVAMGYLPHRNLHQAINDVPRDKICQIVNQVAQAARFLEENSLVHRDIKPDNIAISDDFNHATLLDLGVLRPVGLSSITDQGGQQRFVGTLQYSPPEFLTRNEEDTPDAWRSITFYQLGTVLYDLIMRGRIFDQYRNPYARLVHAVGEVIPLIQADDVDAKLLLLAKCCLLKNPIMRRECVSWDDFLSPCPAKESRHLVLERLRKKQCLIRDGSCAAGEEETENQRYVRSLRLLEFLDEVREIARKTRADNKDYFPAFEIRDLETPDKSQAVALAIMFGPSAQHFLNRVFTTVLVKINLIEGVEELIEIGLAAFASDAATEGIDVSEARSVFRGPYDKTIVQTLVEGTLFTCLEQSLDFQATINALPETKAEREFASTRKFAVE